jgi:hypothetical protein
LFLNSAGKYSDLNDNIKNKILVENVEAILSSETSKFFALHQPEKLQQQQNKVVLILCPNTNLFSFFPYLRLSSFILLK